MPFVSDKCQACAEHHAARYTPFVHGLQSVVHYTGWCTILGRLLLTDFYSYTDLLSDRAPLLSRDGRNCSVNPRIYAVHAETLAI